MLMVNSYRFLARSGVALLLLALLCGLGISGLARPGSVRLVAAHPKARTPHEQTWVARATGSGQAPALHVLIVGASVSRGLGASTPGHDYASDLSRMLEARTGRTVDEQVWSRGGVRVAATDHWALPAGQRVVIVQVVTNDFIHGTPLILYQQRLTELLDHVRATSPHASLLCIGAWEPVHAVNRLGTPMLAYDSVERSACAAHGGGFLSPSPIFQHAAWRGPRGRPTAFGRGDDFHPNNEGHRHLAEAILSRLRTARLVHPGADDDQGGGA